MPVGLIGGAISGGASLLSGLLGSSAAQQAAQQQAAAGAKAAGLASQATNQATNYQTGQLSNENTNATPFVSAGQNATTTLAGLLGPNGQLSQGYGSFSAPTAAQAEATPGYQFQLQQGEQALQNSAAASGGLLSTGTAKALDQYSQGLASSNYQNTYNNALNAYNTNFNTWNTSNNNLYNRLFGLSQQGANATANLNAVQAGTTNNLTSNLLGGAQLQGNDIMGIGNAQAAGTVGSANALNSGITGGANSLGQGITLAQLLGAQNASNSGGGSNSMAGAELGGS
jgi:hypothetical protein